MEEEEEDNDRGARREPRLKNTRCVVTSSLLSYTGPPGTGVNNPSPGANKVSVTI